MELSPGTLEAEVHAFAREAGRRPGTAGHRVAEEFLVERMAEVGLRPYAGNGFRLHYRWDGLAFVNLVGELPGIDCSLAPVLIGAHYDSVIDAPCADDNAAAVAISLAVARALVREPQRRGVVFAFFDAEEPPYFLSPAMGSIRFHHDQMRKEKVAVALIMDLVGHDVDSPLGVPELLFVTGPESHARLPEAIRKTREEQPIIATQNRLVGDLSDHAVFREHGIPYLFLTCGRWEHYHEPSDVPSRLNYAKLAQIGGFLLRLTRELRAGEWGQAGDGNTTAFEIDLLRETLGPRLPSLLTALGIRGLATREDLDNLALRLQARFGL